MKNSLILFIFNVLFCQTFLNAQTDPVYFEVVDLKISGDINKKINLVILSEGYQEHELDAFITNANTLINTMFSRSPFKEYTNYFNVYAIKVPSNESGADHPANSTNVDETGNTPVFVDTYFNTTYDAFGNHYLLFYEVNGQNANNSEQIISNVLADNFPMYDQALLLVNSTEYGGSGGKFPVTYSGYWGTNVAIHEMGHSLFELLDEYYPGDLLAREGINMTQETDPTQVKWVNWYDANKAGIHQHHSDDSDENPEGWYKPNDGTCIMESIDKPFCSVCKEGIIEKIHDLTTPIDTYSPSNTTVEADNFPINFQLQLAKPSPNTLISKWILNTNDFAENIDAISITEANLLTGTNILTAVITDDSNLLKVDNHENIHVYTVTWTINYSTLGILDIKSETNILTITMFPNPTQDILNLKIENRNNQPLQVNIISMDGKIVKSIILSNLELQQIDISLLNSGIYLAQFYSGTTLISSKRLIKH